MNNALLVAVGGALGALCRYAVSTITIKCFGDGFPWGTICVNALGCFLIGVAAGFMERSAMPRTLWLLLVTGFLGGFTTFSAFSLETVQMLRSGAALKAIGNMAINAVGGIAACALGLAAALRIATRCIR